MAWDTRFQNNDPSYLEPRISNNESSLAQIASQVNPSMTTSAIQTIVNNNRSILFTDGTYTFTDRLVIPDNTKIVFSKNAILKFNQTPSLLCVLISTNNVKLENITIDANSLNNIGIYINSTAVNVTIDNAEIKNCYSNGSGSYGIQIVNGASNININSPYIHDLTSVENGVEGDVMGANRGILVGNVTKCVIKNGYFERIDGFEDGDHIAVQPATLGDNSDVVIDSCRFVDYKKRAIKIQASGVVVTNNICSSTYVGEGNQCPSTGISIQANNCIVTNNKIYNLRSVSGIDVWSSGNIVSDNEIEVDKAKVYTTARGNSIYGGILFYFNCDNITIKSNIISTSGRGINGYNQTLRNISVIGNIFKLASTAIRFENTLNNGIISNNIIAGDGTNNMPYEAIKLITCNNVQVSNNLIENATFGIRLQGTSTALQISNNTFVTIPSNTNKIKNEVTDISQVLVGINQQNKIIYGSANPTIGAWLNGDICYNTAPTASGTIGWVCTTAGTANNTAWVTSTAYTVGQQINYNSKVYQCTTAGTSGSTPPTGTGSSITDGTVVWKYVDVLAIFKTFGNISA